MEKRATVIDSIRAADENVLLLDSGDLLNALINPLRHEYVVKVYNELGYDAWTPGDQDFIEGLDFYLNNLLQAKMTMLNTNLRYGGFVQGSRYIIRKFGDVRIGITATFNPKLHQLIKSYSRKSVTADPAEPELRAALDEMKDKCDYIMLLSHSGIDRDRELISEFPEINLIIGAHSQTVLAQPEKINDSYLVQAGRNGYHVGILNLEFDGEDLNAAEGKLILLTNRYPDHPKIRELISEYDQRVKMRR